MAPYSNNNHRGFKTRHVAEAAYANYVRKHRAGMVEVGNIVVAKPAPRLAVKNTSSLCSSLPLQRCGVGELDVIMCEETSHIGYTVSTPCIVCATKHRAYV